MIEPEPAAPPLTPAGCDTVQENVAPEEVDESDRDVDCPLPICCDAGVMVTEGGASTTTLIC